MSQKTAILGLFTETSLHAGTGQMQSNIDLPIQRESHTSYPCVYGSGVKGALRELAESHDFKENWITEVFGPDMQNGSEHAGALGISDARLLLLPVRSLTGHFKWVTCPAILDRWKADYQRLGLREDNGFALSSIIDNETALVHHTLPEQDLFLEEFRFKTQTNKNVNDIINNIIKVINNNIKANLIKQLVIINDDMFAHLCRYATPVDAHIAIDNETKITKPGALWYEETLPPNTLLYTSLIAQNSRKPKEKNDKKVDANEILGHVINDLFPQDRPYLRMGGNETVGMGWCKVKVLQGVI